MLDQKLFRKKFFLKIFSDPFFLFPFATGITLFVINWASFNSSLLMLISMGIIISSIGIFASKFVLFGNKYAQEILDDVSKEEEQKNDLKLDALKKQLCYLADHEKLISLFSDLRITYKQFKEEAVNSKNVFVREEILKSIKSLFDSCVDRFEKIIKLSEDISNVVTKKAQDLLKKERKQIISEVEECLSNVEEKFIEFKKLNEAGESSSINSDGDLKKISSDLERTLEIAKRVEERKTSELSSIDVREYQNQN